MDFVLISFIEKWIDERRFPREELHVRWWIAVPGLIVVLVLVVALLVAWLG